MLKSWPPLWKYSRFQCTLLSLDIAVVINAVIALDRANAEGALLPVPRLIEITKGRKTDKRSVVDADEVMDGIIKSRTLAKPKETKGL